MTLYLNATTSADDMMVDFIEVRLKSGEVVSLNWDYSGIDRTETGFSAKYSGVYFGEEYADGKLQELHDMVITCVQLYTESMGQADFTIDDMEFCDEDDILSIPDPTFDESFHIFFEPF